MNLIKLIKTKINSIKKNRQEAKLRKRYNEDHIYLDEKLWCLTHRIRHDDEDIIIPAKTGRLRIFKGQPALNWCPVYIIHEVNGEEVDRAGSLMWQPAMTKMFLAYTEDAYDSFNILKKEIDRLDLTKCPCKCSATKK